MAIADKLTTIADNVPKVYEAGKQAQYDEFWDTFQNNGDERNYYYAFANDKFTDETYQPKYDIICNNTITGGAALFYSNYKITDTKVPITIKGSSMQAIFCYASNLKTIRKITVNENTAYPNAFACCYELEEVFFDGVIGKDIDLKGSTKLTYDSLLSIINTLSDTTSGLTLTLSKTAINNAFETSDGAADGSTSSEWAALIATKSNWTISLS